MLYKEELRKNPTILYSIVFLNLARIELPCVFCGRYCTDVYILHCLVLDLKLIIFQISDDGNK